MWAERARPDDAGPGPRAVFIRVARTRNPMRQRSTLARAVRGLGGQRHLRSDQRRAPQRLLARAIRGYAEGVLSAQAIATLRGITVEAAEVELREAGVVY